ncbi:MAG: Gfo/Idh/MocA family oxidoreductase, partial [Fimbriimonadaceae bacterium]|nr:Gfo/Idh/MocA family oxidoreductase [Fimbriimonadaceae bacterium]
MHEIGVAVAGAGFIGPVHVEALRRAGVTVRGIVGVDEAEAQGAADRLGLPKAYRDFAEALADPAVHSVHIATPNKLHFPMAKQALEAGKHVVCEKPLSMTSAESIQLVELADKLGRVGAVNYNIRYYPIALEARQRVRSGELGEVFSVHGSYVQDWLLFNTDYNWRVLASEGGELRAVSDIGTHWLDLVLSITGLKPVEVFADLRIVHETRMRPLGEVKTFSDKDEAAKIDRATVEIETEEMGMILLKCEGGARLYLHVSQVTAGRKNCLRFELAGSKNSLSWNSERPNEVWIGHRNEPNQELLRDPGLLSPEAAKFANYPGGHNEGFPDTFKQLYRDFYGYIGAGDFSAARNFPTFADGHKEIVLC